MNRYEEVAQDLREAINRGDYKPGETIPHQRKLAEQYGVSLYTVREAVSLLQSEGLITPIRRKGTVVRDRTTVRIPLTRYSKVLAPGGAKGPWEQACADQGVSGHAEVVSVERIAAEESIAEALDVAPGTPVVYRQRHMWAGPQVAQIQKAWMPLALVDGTPLAEEAKVEGGVYGALIALGHSPTATTETVTAQQPTPEDIEVMKLAPSTPVLVIERITYGEDGRVLEVLRSIGDADRVQAVYDRLPLNRG
ncbi:GntR family transcriptional regulator [Nocardiopsis sp. NPDC006139]|uniref:GntR family transcriptional regulator n=1 Tax=Nocardiopsis TaxID=2013 RepID=UPI0033B1E2F0